MIAINIGRAERLLDALGDLSALNQHTIETWQTTRLETVARLSGRRSPVGLVLRRPNGQTVVAHKGTPVVTVSGEPSELLLFAYGRQQVARVELEGDEDAVSRVREANLGLGDSQA